MQLPTGPRMRTPKDALITIELHKNHIIVRPVSAEAATRIKRMKRDNNHDQAWKRLLHRLGPEWRCIPVDADERREIGALTEAPLIATGEGKDMRVFWFANYMIEDEFEYLGNNLSIKMEE